MCEGIRQLIAKGKDEGISIGRNEGISIGKNEGINTAFDIIRQLKQGISAEELIAQGTNESVVQQALTLL